MDKQKIIKTMPNNLPTKFLLHQLATNEQDRERFNQVNPNLSVHDNGDVNRLYFTFKIGSELIIIQDADLANDELALILSIRACLSRVNNEAVLGVFEIEYWISLYNDFDFELRYGHPLSEAIEALGQKMLELVPEYVEFCKNNNN